MMNAQYQRGVLLYQQRRYDQAELEFRQALAQDPDDGHCHAFLGLCLSKRKQFAEGTEEARQGIHKSPDAPFTHYALALVLFERNRFDEALVPIEEAIRLNPYDADYFALLSSLHFNESRWTQALDAAQHGLEADPEHVPCNNMRAMALVKLGRKAEAGQTINATLSREPENSHTHANKGWALLEENKPEQAMHHFREALRLQPDNEWARVGIVEAMKARYFTYSLMLRYFLWMAKLGRKAGLGLVIGGYVGYRVLHNIADKNPEWAPYLWPLLVAYIGFAIMSWLARPLFNLMLRFNRFGRLALSADETAASTWIGLTFAMTLLCLVGWVGFKIPQLELGTVCGAVLIMPIAATYNSESGWRRKVMALATVGLFFVAVGMVWLLFLKFPREELPLWESRLSTLSNIYFYGILIVGLGSNVLGSIRPKY